jgi:hypothetical protein
VGAEEFGVEAELEIVVAQLFIGVRVPAGGRNTLYDPLAHCTAIFRLLMG